MAINKREFLKLSGATAGSGLVLAACGAGTTAGRAATLRPLTDDVVPITVEERLARVAKAQSLMAEHGLAGHEIVAIGDGPAEILAIKAVGGLAIGVASDEVARSGRHQK